MPPQRRLLTINTGSSSLKAALYEAQGGQLERKVSALAEGLGTDAAILHVSTGDGAPPRALAAPKGPSHAAVLTAVLEELGPDRLDGAGHRVVHGGSRYSHPVRVDGELLAALQELVSIDPMHLPQAIDAMGVMARLRPDAPQVACFDTAFHRTMPRLAQLYALPRELTDTGIIRYGFHGLSYEYVAGRLRELDPAGADGHVIIAHLGNGASMAALSEGRSIETTMGFTPAGGLVMGTRTGDLDPGVLIHLARLQHRDPEQISQLVNARSGLLGVSGRSSDMRELLAAEQADPHSAQAVDLFCYRARQFIGALAAALTGLDALVFSGGIGEHAAPIRWRICQGLEFLGIRMDESRNAAGAPVVSADGSAVTVRVIPTDEDLMIARHTAQLLWS